LEDGEVATVENGDGRIFIPKLFDNIIEDNLNLNQMQTNSSTAQFDFASSMKYMEGASIIPKGRVLIICYHLPVEIFRTENYERPFTVNWAESLIAKSKNSISSKTDTLWFGTISVPGPEPTLSEIEYLKMKLKEISCYPIFLDSKRNKSGNVGGIVL
jgi:hypothetical protein